MEGGKETLYFIIRLEIQSCSLPEPIVCLMLTITPYVNYFSFIWIVPFLKDEEDNSALYFRIVKRAREQCRLPDASGCHVTGDVTLTSRSEQKADGR